MMATVHKASEWGRSHFGRNMRIQCLEESKNAEARNHRYRHVNALVAIRQQKHLTDCADIGRARSLNFRRGFTLAELMVVIVIIGLLAGVVTLSVRSYLVRSRQNVAKMEIAKMCQAIDTYYSHFDQYPTNEKGITALTEKSEAFADGLLSKLPRDPWGHAYEYQCPGRKSPYEVISYGADHREGGTGADADISSDDLGSQAKQTP